MDLSRYFIRMPFKIYSGYWPHAAFFFLSPRCFLSCTTLGKHHGGSALIVCEAMKFIAAFLYTSVLSELEHLSVSHACCSYICSHHRLSSKWKFVAFRCEVKKHMAFVLYARLGSGPSTLRTMNLRAVQNSYSLPWLPFKPSRLVDSWF
jgi:hypothetical protein